MYDKNGFRTIPWNKDNGENSEFAKKAIPEILKSQKVSLSKIRCLFDCIIQEIEDENPINL